MEVGINELVFGVVVWGGIVIIQNTKGKTIIDKVVNAFIQGGFSSLGYIMGLFSIYLGMFSNSPFVSGSIVGNLVMNNGTPSTLYLIIGTILIGFSIYTIKK